MPNDNHSSTPVKTLGSFFRMIEIGAADVDRHPDALDRLRGGEIHAVLVRDVYAEEVLEPVVTRLERHDPPFLKTLFPMKFRSFFFGRNLNLADPDFDRYFREAAAFRKHLGTLFPPGLGITDYVAGLLAELDHGRPFEAPPGPVPGQEYMFTTLRAHLEGGYIPAHCDNEAAIRPSYRHLRTIVEPHMISFVLALTMAESGGSLDVYDYRLDPVAMTVMNDDNAVNKPDLAQLESVRFRLAAGSMILLDSGRYLHGVSPVGGSRKRWTACSFMAMSRARDAMFCWG